MKTIAYILLTSAFTLSAGAFASPVASGKIILPAKLAPAAQGIRTVFVSVYKAGKPGMPYGATKIELKGAPKSGEVAKLDLDTETLMMMTQQEMLPGKVDIKVKLDKDGSAGPDDAGDLVGWAKGVKIGSKNVVVKLDRQVR